MRAWRFLRHRKKYLLLAFSIVAITLALFSSRPQGDQSPLFGLKSVRIETAAHPDSIPQLSITLRNISKRPLFFIPKDIKVSFLDRRIQSATDSSATLRIFLPNEELKLKYRLARSGGERVGKDDIDIKDISLVYWRTTRGFLDQKLGVLESLALGYNAKTLGGFKVSSVRAKRFWFEDETIEEVTKRSHEESTTFWFH